LATGPASSDRGRAADRYVHRRDCRLAWAAAGRGSQSRYDGIALL